MTTRNRFCKNNANIVLQIYTVKKIEHKNMPFTPLLTLSCVFIRVFSIRYLYFPFSFFSYLLTDYNYIHYIYVVCYCYTILTWEVSENPVVFASRELEKASLSTCYFALSTSAVLWLCFSCCSVVVTVFNFVDASVDIIMLSMRSSLGGCCLGEPTLAARICASV